MHLKDLAIYLELLLNKTPFSDYCPNGLQCEGQKEVKRIGTAVTANEETIEQAVDKEVDALIVHHGLFWNGDPYPLVGTKKRKVELLIKNGISLFAYHLPLDAHPEIGNNWKAARDLGWRELEPFGLYNGSFIGVKGEFAPQPIEKLIASLEAYYGHTATKALGGKKTVKSCALISGGAYGEMSQAAKEDIDCFATGNFDLPAWDTAMEEGINFLALGHTATEKIGPRALAEHLKAELELPAFFIDVKNPF